MSDLEHSAIELLKVASEISLKLYKQPLVITYSGGKDSDVLLHLAGKAAFLCACLEEKLEERMLLERGMEEE